MESLELKITISKTKNSVDMLNSGQERRQKKGLVNLQEGQWTVSNLRTREKKNTSKH